MNISQTIDAIKRINPHTIFLPCIGEAKPWRPAVKNFYSKEVMTDLAELETDFIAQKLELGRWSVLAMICGKDANLLCVDFDNLDAVKKCENALHKSIDELCNFIVKTRRGFHLFFQYDPAFKSGALIKGEIDIKAEKGFSWGVPLINSGYELHTQLETASLDIIPSDLKDWLLGFQTQNQNNFNSQSSQNQNGFATFGFAERKITSFTLYDEPLIWAIKDYVDNTSHLADHDIDESAESLIINRLFKGSKTEFKSASKQGGRQNTTIRLAKIFASDATISEDDFFDVCARFVDEVVKPEEKAQRKFKDWFKSYGEEQFSYDENWEQNRQNYLNVINHRENSSPSNASNASNTSETSDTSNAAKLSWQERLAVIRAGNPIVDEMFRQKKFFYYHLKSGRWKKIDLKTGAVSVYSAAKEMMQTFASNYLKVLPPKASYKLLPIIEDEICDPHKTPGLFMDEGVWMVNTFGLGENDANYVLQYDDLRKKHQAGEKVEPLHLAELDDKSKMIFLNCFKDLDDATHYYRSLAHHLANPNAVPMKIHCINGTTQGTGKSLIFSLLGKILFGRNSINVNSESLKGQFNAQFANKDWVCFDDPRGISNDLNELIKTLVGSPSIVIHRKGKDIEDETQNKAFYTLTSNAVAPFKVEGAEERRIVLYEGSDSKFNVKLFGQYFDAEKELKERMPQLFRILITLEDEMPSFYPQTPYRPDRLERLAKLNPRDDVEAVAKALIKVSADETISTEDAEEIIGDTLSKYICDDIAGFRDTCVDYLATRHSGVIPASAFKQAFSGKIKTRLFEYLRRLGGAEREVLYFDGTTQNMWIINREKHREFNLQNKMILKEIPINAKAKSTAPQAQTASPPSQSAVDIVPRKTGKML